MLLDANILLYAWNADSPHHEKVRAFLAPRWDGSTRVGLPLQTLSAFLRISTDARITQQPALPGEAAAVVRVWLARPGTWTPTTTQASTDVFLDLVEKYALSGRLIPDAQLAALALEHGLPVVSADSDFARFPEITWIDPLR